MRLKSSMMQSMDSPDSGGDTGICSAICPGLVCTELNDATKIMGMPADDFAAKALPQIEADEFFIVSHSFNRVHIDERYSEVTTAFDRYAPRYDGDDEYDVRAIVTKMIAAAAEQDSEN